MSRGSIWRALAGSPGRFLLSSWPWRSLAYLLSTILVAAAALIAILPVLLFPPALVLAGLPVGALERRRLILLRQAPAQLRRGPAPPGAIAWARCRLGEGATWRELAYTLCLLSALVLADLLAIFALLVCLLFAALPLVLSLDSLSVRLRLGSFVIDSIGKAWIASAGIGLPATIIAIYAVCVLAGAQGSFARWLLTPADGLERQVAELTESRTRLVNAFEAERRRIERDLHDGAQQHLLLLSMNLGLAQLELAESDQRARELVAEAHQQARQALAAIREQIRGIHPQVLADFGLSAAVGELAERCPIPVHLDLEVGFRLPAAVESTAYFFVSEALTNSIRHSRASHVSVSGRLADNRLLLAVTDDGCGGADDADGSGLRGLADRAAVMDGTVKVTSPAGGPTTLRLELPCRCG
jgi:signal transduction histidine kinase